MSGFFRIFEWILITSLMCVLSLFVSTIFIRVTKVFWLIDLIEEVRKKNSAAALVLLGLLLMIGGIVGFSLLGIQRS